ncbi:MAG: tetratricopeptide repeat protein, partial [Flavobacteriales bacterium]
AEQVQGIDRAQILANNKAGTFYGQENYKRAAEMFQTSIKAAAAFDIVDTLGIYNTALCHEKAGMIPEAIEGYKKTAELGYQVPNVFLFVANLQKQQGDEAAALETLAAARKDYPREQSLIIEELNIYINRGDFELAKTNLEIAAEQDPTNELLWFSLGTISDNLGKTEEAQSAYVKALEVNPDYFDANYNLGAMYFNKGVEKVKVANDVPPRETKKYDAIMSEANAAFQQALPYLEKAFEVNSADVQTIRSLRDIYARTGNDDKMLEMKKILDGMGK